ncbi:60S acidic ribosomal protein P2 [Aphanomyces cochlioides]|nr:60S acidic ribosomal protein P2 [Aphanomyces cochlioides]
MRYVAAYLLVALAKEDVTADDVTKVLTSAGVEIDSERLNKLFEDVAGKSIDEIIAAGSSKLAKFGGGAAPAAAAAGAAAPAADAGAAKKDEPKEEEADLDLGGGMDMFGGSSDY